MKLHSTKTIRDIKDRHDFKLSKALGQNFLTDENIVETIVDSSDISSNDLVIEIGPGMGVLTEEALKKAGKVIAIELDQRLIPILKETLSEYDNLEIIKGDILKTDIKEIIKQNTGYDRVKIIGNLPYYITTPIIMKILEEGIPAQTITVMMQKEVADRIKATVGTREAGAISVAVQFYCEVYKIIDVPKESFLPKPKVDSTVILLEVRKTPAIDTKDKKIFFECVKKGFGQRRKTIGNSLVGTAGVTKEELIEILNKSNIDSVRRAETLSLEEFCRIADAIAEKKING